MRIVSAARVEGAAGSAASPHRPVLAVRLAAFVAERFPPQAYGPLIVALVACGWTAAALASGRRAELGWPAAGAAAAVTLAFLQLRVLDEIRDAGEDRLGRPSRPVPRGLVSIVELRALAVVAALAAIGVALPLGVIPCAMLGLTLAIIWGLGTGQPRRLGIRYGVIGEALVHSIIAPALLLFVWLSGGPIGSGAALAASIALVWGAGLALEGSRKIVRPDEERPGVATYSAALGRPRALFLTALAVSASCLGAAGFAVAVGAPPVAIAVPLVGSIALPPAARRFGAAAGTAAIRFGATATILCLLLWPVVVLAVVP